MKKQGFWRLLGAYELDFVIAYLGGRVLWHLFAICFSYVFMSLGGSVMPMWSAMLSGCLLIFGLLYFAGSEYWLKKTLGKRLFGVKALVLNEGKHPSLGKFLKAYAIDCLAVLPILIVCILSTMVMQMVFCYDHCSRGREMGIIMGIGFVTLSLLALYFAVCEYFWGKTLGKKLMGLQVVQEETK